MIKEKLTNYFRRDRIHPKLFSMVYYPLIAIRDFLEDSIKEYRKGKNGLNILDFGCGNQPYKYIFINDNYFGCDIGASPEYNDKMTVIAEGDKLPYNDETFDIIISTEVFEHIKYPELYSNEIIRVLKKGGLLLMTVPQNWSYHPYPQHFFNYTPDGLNLFFGNKLSYSKYYSDTNSFQTGLFFTMNYFNNMNILVRIPYILLVNLFFMLFPKYKEYNDSSLHIFAYYIK